MITCTALREEARGTQIRSLGAVGEMISNLLYSFYVFILPNDWTDEINNILVDLGGT